MPNACSVLRALVFTAAAVMVGCSAPLQPAAQPHRVPALQPEGPTGRHVMQAEPRAQPQLPYRTEEVRISNPASGIKLAGSLTLPSG
ncbi:MAG: hypothetical protein ACK46X_11760, partial [Candidatus Sericytochromatia bacterium]